MINVAILGASGMLGTYCSIYLGQKYHITEPVFRAEDMTVDDMVRILRDYRDRIDVIINCIGVIKQRTHVSPRTMIAVNAVFPHTLQFACDILNIKLIHVTTDCVFSGKVGFYTETAVHDAADIYGRSKSLGEPARATVVRTSIIGSERKGKLSLLEWVKAQDGKECMGYINHTWNGVTCLQLAKLFGQIIERNDYWEGVRHYFADDLSKHELVNYIANAYSLDIKVKEFVAPDRKQMTLRTIHPTMKPSLLLEAPLYPVPHIFEQLKELRIFDEENGLYDRLQRY